MHIASYISQMRKLRCKKAWQYRNYMVEPEIKSRFDYPKFFIIPSIIIGGTWMVILHLKSEGHVLISE